MVRAYCEISRLEDPEWPHDKSMTIGRLAGHVAELPSWAIETINKPSLAIEPGYKAFHATSTKELLEVFDARVAEARAAISGASDDHLQHMWTLSFGGHKVFSLPRHSVLRSVVMNHLIHHRGQLQRIFAAEKCACAGYVRSVRGRTVAKMHGRFGPAAY